MLRETEVPLLQEDWKKEHGKRFMPCTNEYLENPIMLVFSDVSEIVGEDCEGKQVEKDLAGRSEKEGAKEDFDPPEAEGVGVRLWHKGFAAELDAGEEEVAKLATHVAIFL